MEEARAAGVQSSGFINWSNLGGIPPVIPEQWQFAFPILAAWTLKIGLNLVLVSKYWSARPSPSGTSLSDILSMFGGRRVSCAPRLTNTQLLSDSQPWHRTQLATATGSLPASQHNMELLNSLIIQPVLQTGSSCDVCLGFSSPSVKALCAVAPSTWAREVLVYNAGIQQGTRHPGVCTSTYPNTCALNKHPLKDSQTQPMRKWATDLFITAPEATQTPSRSLEMPPIRAWLASYTCVHPFLQDRTWGRVSFSGDKYLTPLESASPAFESEFCSLLLLWLWHHFLTYKIRMTTTS